MNYSVKDIANMTGTPVRRTFNKESYEENDKVGKDTVIRFFASKGIKAYENPDRYGIDLFIDGVSSTGRVFKHFPVEVERRLAWKKKEFPFTTVFIPERKRKFFFKNCFYAVVNNDCNKVMFCSSLTIMKSKLMEVPNQSCAEGECFFIVPLSSFSIYEIN